MGKGLRNWAADSIKIDRAGNKNIFIEANLFSSYSQLYPIVLLLTSSPPVDIG